MTRPATITTVSQFWDWLDRNDDREFWALFEDFRPSASTELGVALDRHADYLCECDAAAAHRSEVNFGC